MLISNFVIGFSIIQYINSQADATDIPMAQPIIPPKRAKIWLKYELKCINWAKKFHEKNPGLLTKHVLNGISSVPFITGYGINVPRKMKYGACISNAII